MNEHIAHATNERLAEMLQSLICMKDASGRCYFQNPNEAIEIVDEAARRLRIPPYKTFQDEYMGEAT